jgi:hypothetical protein
VYLVAGGEEGLNYEVLLPGVREPRLAGDEAVVYQAEHEGRHHSWQHKRDKFSMY